MISNKMTKNARDLALTPVTAPKAEPEEGETYHLTQDELKELNEYGTVQCEDGCTIVVDEGE